MYAVAACLVIVNGGSNAFFFFFASICSFFLFFIRNMIFVSSVEFRCYVVVSVLMNFKKP